MQKANKKIIQSVYLIILVLFPFFRVGQGLSVMDTTYALSNYAFFNEMNGTWMVATFLANVLGKTFMSLPFGDTLLGMNIYTSCVVSLTAVTAFIFLKRDISSHILFLGEMIALSLCWCPTTILYNYLTYLLFTLGALTLYRALTGGRQDLYVAAGILLGLNITTRFPNITEAALIVVVWVVAFLEKKKFMQAFRETLMCLCGYVIGFIVPLFLIAIRFTSTAYTDMIKNLFAMTDKATDYKPVSMIGAMFGDYIYAGKWILEFALGAAACGVVYWIMHHKGKNCRILCIVASVAVFAFITRVAYGQGMFTLNYYEYRSMYFWAVIFIACATIASFAILCVKSHEIHPVSGDELVLHHKKILGLIALVVTYVTCLGSNNAMYPIVNNLFIVAPFLLWCTYDCLVSVYRNKDKAGIRQAVRYGMCVTTVAISGALLIQGIFFHSSFALQDGDEGQTRDSYIEGYERTAYIRTTQTNAESLKGLMDYVEENGRDVSEVILYGDIPGLGFILNKSSALTTFWPDLDSYTYDEWSRDLHVIELEVQSGKPAPYIITAAQIDKAASGQDKKLEDLINMMQGCGYREVFSNDSYSVYYVESE